MAAAILAQFVVTIVQPNGVLLDVTNRTNISSVGSVSEALEDDLLKLTHSDFDLELEDADGSLAEMFRNSKRTEVWELKVERYTGNRRVRWDLLFAGVLDVPLSVEIDRKSKTVSVQAFSYSKLLETVDVSTQHRDSGTFPDRVTGQLAFTTAGSPVVGLVPGFSTSTFLKVGDKIAVDDGVSREEHVVSATVGTTGLNTVENFQNTMNDASIELLTPWPWHQTIEEIVSALLTLAGVDGINVQLDNVTARVPFGSGFDPNGAGTGWSLMASSIAWEGDNFGPIGNHSISVRVGGARYEAETPSSGFSGKSAPTGDEADWTPYLSSQPVSLETIPVDVQSGEATDTQLNISPVPDDSLDWVAAYDHDAGNTYTLRQRHQPASDDPQIRLYKNSILLSGVTSVAGGAADKYHTAFLDWFERSAHGFADDIAVVSTQAHDGTRSLDIVNLGTAAAVNVATGDGSGGGGVRTLGSRGVVAVQEAATSDLNQPNIPADINFWKPVAAGSGYIELDRTISNQPTMQMWTMRSFGDFIGCLYLVDTPTDASATGFQKRATRVRIWRWDTLAEVADFEVANVAHKQMFATTATIGGVECMVVNINRFMTVISTEWVGTVPYINYDDIGGAAAVRDIAVLGLAYFYVDAHKIGYIRGRGSEAGTEIEIDADTVLEHSEQPLTDDFMASIEVSGKDRSGQEFTVVVGDKHDSSNRGSIDSSLIRDTGLAESLGEGYFSLLGGARREHNIEIELNGQVIHANDLILLDNSRYRVIEADTDLEAQTQTLRLVEILRKADAA